MATNNKCRAMVGTHFALNTGTNIPSVGFGTWKIPKEKAKETVKQAIECGYRHLDCALEYGNQEEIGASIHELIESKQITRGELFITSKLWNTHHKRHSAYNDIDTTLRQLNLHHLDLWLMHWPLAFVPASTRAGENTQSAKDQDGNVMQDTSITILETWKAMEEMHKDGKARAIGVSNFTLPQLEQLLSVCEIRPAVVQIELHPYLQQVELVEFCQSKGIHVTAYSPLGSQAEESVDILQDPVLQEIAKAHNKTPGQVVLQWDLQRHISVVPKASSPEHMQENLQVFDFDLTSDEVRKIEGLERGMRFLSAKKLWGISLFPDETGEVTIEQAVGDMFANVETQQSK